MNYKICKAYQDENDVRCFDVEIGNKTIKGIKAIKLEKGKCKKCGYYNSCQEEYVVRKFDCKRNLDKLQMPYIFITVVITFIITSIVFRKFQYNFFTKIAILLIVLVCLDIVCTLVEIIVPKIYKRRFNKKLKRILKKQEKLKEMQFGKEDKLADMLIYSKIKAAKSIVQTLMEISGQCDFGPNQEKINNCLEKCEVIVQRLEEKPSGYLRVTYLFEVYLPELGIILINYSNLVNSKAVTMEEQIVTECIDNVLKFLDLQRVKAIFDKDYVKIEFKASANALNQALKEELNK